MALTTGADYTKKCLHGYEVKAHRADLVRDLGEHKWARYLGPLDRLTFAFPADLAAPEEIPELCAVLTYHP